MHFTVTQWSYCNGYWQSEIPRANLIFHIEEGNISSPSSFAVPISNQLISSSAHHFPYFLLCSSPSSHLPLSPSLPGQPLTFPFPASHLRGRSPFPSRLFTFPAFLSWLLTFPAGPSPFPSRPLIFPHALSSSRLSSSPHGHSSSHTPFHPPDPQILPKSGHIFPQIPSFPKSGLCSSPKSHSASQCLSGFSASPSPAPCMLTDGGSASPSPAPCMLKPWRSIFCDWGRFGSEIAHQSLGIFGLSSPISSTR